MHFSTFDILQSISDKIFMLRFFCLPRVWSLSTWTPEVAFCFLTQQDLSGSSLLQSAPDLEPLISPRGSGFCHIEIVSQKHVWPSVCSLRLAWSFQAFSWAEVVNIIVRGKTPYECILAFLLEFVATGFSITLLPKLFLHSKEVMNGSYSGCCIQHYISSIWRVITPTL